MVARNPVAIIDNVSSRDPHCEDSFGLGENHFVVVANGVSPAKGPHILVQAIAELKNRNPDIPLKVLIVGSSPPDHQNSVDQLKQRVTQFGLADTIQFPGYVQNLSGLLRHADVVVSPSYSESLPSFLVEAMARQVPIVATSVGDCPELLANGALGQLVPPGDSSALAAAIQNVHRDPSRFCGIAVKAQTQVMSDYAPENIWPEIERAIAAVARRVS